MVQHTDIVSYTLRLLFSFNTKPRHSETMLFSYQSVSDKQINR
jgi:hypothetical protein